MSDKIVVMKDGEIQQIGTPTDIYNEPANEYVARFIGESNIIDGIMVQDKEVIFEDKHFACLDGGFAPNEKVDVVIRPEDLDIVPKEQGKLKGVVKSVLFKGVHYENHRGNPLWHQYYRNHARVGGQNRWSTPKPKRKMSANDFYLDLEDIAELNDADIIARADAQAWDAETEDWISIHKVEYQIEPKIGTYPVTFSTKAGTMVSAQMFVREANRIASKEYEEEIYAVNFFKKWMKSKRAWRWILICAPGPMPLPGVWKTIRR